MNGDSSNLYSAHYVEAAAPTKISKQRQTFQAEQKNGRHGLRKRNQRRFFGFPVPGHHISTWQGNLGCQDQGQQRHAAVQAISHL